MSPDDTLAATLTEKEREVLRLILRGHDAKSAGNALDISIYAVNERLRSARRKLGVTSSREAARVLHSLEEPDNNSLVHTKTGDACSGESDNDSGSAHPATGSGAANRWITAVTAGALTMSIAIACLAIVTQPVDPAAQPVTYEAVLAERLPAVEEAARNWLALTDSFDWEASHAAADDYFREFNSLADWTATSRNNRETYGAVVSRDHLQSRNVDAGEGSFRIVMFRTQFADGQSRIEALSLCEEDDAWNVTSYTVD